MVIAKTDIVFLICMFRLKIEFCIKIVITRLRNKGSLNADGYKIFLSRLKFKFEFHIKTSMFINLYLSLKIA